MYLPLNPYEEIALTGLAPGEKSEYECELCERRLAPDDVFLLRHETICCEDCYDDAMRKDELDEEV